MGQISIWGEAGRWILLCGVCRIEVLKPPKDECSYMKLS